MRYCTSCSSDSSISDTERVRKRSRETERDRERSREIERDRERSREIEFLVGHLEDLGLRLARGCLAVVLGAVRADAEAL